MSLTTTPISTSPSGDSHAAQAEAPAHPSVLSHNRHLPALDGLRGVAILLVAACHLYPYPYQRASSLPVRVADVGWVGVDLFFVLSGFLITGILYDTRGRPHFFKTFYARRGLRLLPVYLVAVIYVLAVGWRLGDHPTWWAAPYLFYLTNVVSALHVATGLDGRVPTVHFWSLAAEEQFYLVWPLLVYLLQRRRKILRASLVGIVVAEMLRLALIVHPLLYINTYTALPTRMDAFLVGGVMAMLFRDARSVRLLKPVTLYAVSAAGLSVFALAMWRSGSPWAFTLEMRAYGYTGLAVLFAAIVGLCAQPTPLAAVCRTRVLRVFGKYSYGFYLWHELLFPHVIARWLAVPLNWLPLPVVPRQMALFTIETVFFLGVAWLSFVLIERPFLRMKRFFAYE